MNSSDLVFEEKSEYWLSPQGKKIPYLLETAHICFDGWGEWVLEISRWPLNTKVVVCNYYGEAGSEMDSDERWCARNSHLIVKVPHAVFVANREVILQKAIDFALSS